MSEQVENYYSLEHLFFAVDYALIHRDHRILDEVS